jgi:hypothetical protein
MRNSLNLKKLNHASLNVAWLNRIGEPLSAARVSKKALTNPKGDVTIIREANVDGLSMEVVCSVKGEKPEA